MCWVISGPLVDTCWVMSGPLVDVCWVTCGPPVGVCWVTCGPPVNLISVTHCTMCWTGREWAAGAWCSTTSTWTSSCRWLTVNPFTAPALGNDLRSVPLSFHDTVVLCHCPSMTLSFCTTVLPWHCHSVPLCLSVAFIFGLCHSVAVCHFVVLSFCCALSFLDGVILWLSSFGVVSFCGTVTGAVRLWCSVLLW